MSYTPNSVLPVIQALRSQFKKILDGTMSEETWYFSVWYILKNFYKIQLFCLVTGISSFIKNYFAPQNKIH